MSNDKGEIFMKITFLGQAGFLLEKNDKKILIDPYLSDNVKNVNPKNYRRQPIDEQFLKIEPDVIVITHAHLDHYDKETLKHYFKEDSKISVLSPTSVWKDVKDYGGDNNYILFNVLTSVSLYGLEFTAVKAEHSDEYAIGVVVKDENDAYYFTGDTLYNENIFRTLPTKRFKAVFLPINGVGNNMNVIDAVKFVKKLKTQKVVPCHFGLFDNMTGYEFFVKGTVVPQIYKEIEL